MQPALVGAGGYMRLGTVLDTVASTFEPCRLQRSRGREVCEYGNIIFLPGTGGLRIWKHHLSMVSVGRLHVSSGHNGAQEVVL